MQGKLPRGAFLFMRLFFYTQEDISFSQTSQSLGHVACLLKGNLLPLKSETEQDWKNPSKCSFKFYDDGVILHLIMMKIGE